MISLKHVSNSFDGGQHFAVDNFSFDVYEGETFVLLGSSGLSGQSRLGEISQGGFWSGFVVSLAPALLGA